MPFILILLHYQFQCMLPFVILSPFLQAICKKKKKTFIAMRHSTIMWYEAHRKEGTFLPSEASSVAGQEPDLLAAPRTALCTTLWKQLSFFDLLSLRVCFSVAFSTSIVLGFFFLLLIGKKKDMVFLFYDPTYLVSNIFPQAPLHPPLSSGTQLHCCLSSARPLLRVFSTLPGLPSPLSPIPDSKDGVLVKYLRLLNSLWHLLSGAPSFMGIFLGTSQIPNCSTVRSITLFFYFEFFLF